MCQNTQNELEQRILLAAEKLGALFQDDLEQTEWEAAVIARQKSTKRQFDQAELELNKAHFECYRLDLAKRAAQSELENLGKQLRLACDRWNAARVTLFANAASQNKELLFKLVSEYGKTSRARKDLEKAKLLLVVKCEEMTVLIQKAADSRSAAALQKSKAQIACDSASKEFSLCRHRLIDFDEYQSAQTELTRAVHAYTGTEDATFAYSFVRASDLPVKDNRERLTHKQIEEIVLAAVNDGCIEPPIDPTNNASGANPKVLNIRLFGKLDIASCMVDPVAEVTLDCEYPLKFWRVSSLDIWRAIIKHLGEPGCQKSYRISGRKFNVIHFEEITCVVTDRRPKNGAITR